MSQAIRSGTAVIILLMLLVLLLGCSGSGGSGGNPILPDDDWSGRQAMDFQTGTQTIFGTPSNVASEVDLASVVWGQVSVLTGCGDVVKWEDGTLEGTSWVAAIGIEQQDDPSMPSIPVVRFLRNDGTTMSPEFPVLPNPAVLGQDCHFPRIDCTYLGDGKVQATVAFRYGADMSNWDLQLHHLVFKYTLAGGWELHESLPITSLAMINPATGQTHPDIAYDQASGDVYCAWTEITGIAIDVVYQRFSGDPPIIITAVPLSLSHPVMTSGWFVSLDVGKVMLPWGAVPERVVAFAYTAQQPNGFLGLHPVVGWWNIDAGPDDSDHEPNHVLIQYLYWPEEPDHPYHAGMIRVDIPCDNAPGHGGAVVFVQDTEIGWGYQVFGISSLYLEYAWISGPGCGPFTQATLPSIAIHDVTGTTAAVTYFAKYRDGLWAVWATHWEIDRPHGLGATEVDLAASGEFELDVDTLMNYDFGTGSSLAFSGANTYWAAWSDKLGGIEPVEVRGSMGFAYPW